jgi:class 3 adenylate cyclase
MAEVTDADVARRLDVPPATLLRWARTGVVPLRNGAWTPAAERGRLAIMDGLHRRLLRHVVERVVTSVETSLPEDARVVKTIGDEVMVVGSDPGALADRAVGHQRRMGDERPRPWIGMHAGAAIYRDGDYCGAADLAARVAARAAGGEAG